MTNVTKSLFKTISEKAKETALEGKERFTKWAENEKTRKFKENVQRKDVIGNEILFVKEQIAKTEATLDHLHGVSVQVVTVAIEGMDIAVSTEIISTQYETKLALLIKRKEKLGKEFLILEEKINSEKDIAEKIDALEKQKESRFRSIKNNAKEAVLVELLPLIAAMPNYLTNGDELIFEESFGLLELRYKDGRLECFHNGLIINMKLDVFRTIEQVGIVDWRTDEAIYLANGNVDDITLLNWKNGTPPQYESAFFDMTRALKYVYMNHFEQA